MQFIKRTIALVLISISMDAVAQSGLPYRGFTGLSWEMGFPFESKYLDEPSFSGWRLEYRKILKGKFSVGLGMSWNSFDQKIPKQTYNSEDGVQAVTTDMIRQVYTVPITALFHYYPSVKGKMIQPYFGIGLGTQFTEFNTYFNIYQIQEKNWGFVGRPEIGALISFGDSPAKAMINVGYNYATNQYDEFDISHVSHLAVSVGIAITH